MASKVASLIRGKHKTNFTPHVDCGDNVIVINAAEVNLTGQKWDQKEFRNHVSKFSQETFRNNYASFIKKKLKS